MSADDDALADGERPVAPAGHDQGGEGEGEADEAAPEQDHPEVAVGLAEGGADLWLAGLRDGEGEDPVEVEAGRRDGDHAQHGGNQDGTAEDVELLAVEHVHLDVQHGGPDPHGGHDLHQGEAPVRHEELQALEQHQEGAHDQGQGGEPPAALAELEHGLLDGVVVAAVDGLDQAADARPHALRRFARERERRSGPDGAASLPPMALGALSSSVTGRSSPSPAMVSHHCRPERGTGKGSKVIGAACPNLRSLALDVHDGTSGEGGRRWRVTRGSSWRTNPYLRRSPT